MTEQEIEIINNRSEHECLEIKRRDCKHCIYCPVSTQLAYVICEYLAITGKSRPCLAGECRQKGVFIPKKKKGKRNK